MEEKVYKELIPGRIFIGGINGVNDLLNDEKIDVIYDLRAELNGPLSSNISVHQPILDDMENQDKSIQAAVDKVIHSYNNEENVYFHCNTGRGRAGTIATAILLELELAKSVDEALEMANEMNPQINVRPHFKEALVRIYEK